MSHQSDGSDDPFKPLIVPANIITGRYTHQLGLCIGIGDADWLPEIERAIEPRWPGYTRFGIDLSASSRRFQPKWTLGESCLVYGLILFDANGKPELLHLAHGGPKALEAHEVVEWKLDTGGNP